MFNFRKSSRARHASTTKFTMESLEDRRMMTGTSWHQAAVGSYSYSTGIYISETNPDAKLLLTDYGGAYRWIEDAGTTDPQWQAVADNIIAADDASLTDPDARTLDQGMAAAAFDTNDPTGNTVWLQTVNGIYKSTNFAGDDAVEWTDLEFPGTDRGAQFTDSDGEPAEGQTYRLDRSNRLSLDPSNSNVAFAGSIGQGLWRTADGGATWTSIADSEVPTIDYTVRPNGWDGTPEGLTHWTSSVSFVVVDPSQGTVQVDGQAVSRRVYVGVRGQGVFVSNDGGQSFQRISGGTNQPQVTEIADGRQFDDSWDRTTTLPSNATVDSNGNLYMTVTRKVGEDLSAEQDSDFETGSGSVWRYDGSSWADITPETGRSYNGLDIWENPQNGEVRLFVAESEFAGENSLFVTNDATASSVTWSDISADDSNTNNQLPAQLGNANNGLASMTVDPSDPDGDTVWVTGGWTNYRNEDVLDSTSSWVEVARGHEELFSYDLSVSAKGKLFWHFADRGGAIIDSGDLQGRNHRMWNWSRDGIFGLEPGEYSYTQPYTYNSDADSTTTAGNPDYAARIGDGLLQGDHAFSGYSLDGGESWTEFGSFPNSIDGQAAGQIVASPDVQPMTFTVADEKTGVPTSVTRDVPKSLVWVTSDPENSTFYSKDNGNTWLKSGGLTDSSPYFINNLFWGGMLAADPVDGDTFYYMQQWSGSGQNVNGEAGNWFYSTDGGANWQRGSEAGANGSTVLPDVTQQTNVVPVPGHAHKVMVSSENRGLFYSPQAQTQNPDWQKIDGFDTAISFSFGRGINDNIPAAYVLGQRDVGGGNTEFGIWMSEDLLDASGNLNQSATWAKFADTDTVVDESGQPIPFTLAFWSRSLVADPNVYGRAYIATVGRGLFYGGLKGDAPTIESGASAISVGASGTVQLSVEATDDNGDANLQYHWSTISQPEGSRDPVFRSNDLESSRTSLAQIFQAGSYEFLVTATDAGGQTVSDQVTVNVLPVPMTLGQVNQAATIVATGESRQIFAYDQFDDRINNATGFAIVGAANGNAVTEYGVFTAGSNAGTQTIQASVGGTVLTTNVNIVDPLVDYRAGFTSTANLVLNNHPTVQFGFPTIVGNDLEMLQGRYQITSAFDTREISTDGFYTSFEFQFDEGDEPGDGLALVLTGDDNERITYLNDSESIGYADDPGDGNPNPFANSLAIKFDTINQRYRLNADRENIELSSTGLYVGGESLDGPGDVDLLRSGIDFRSGNPIQVDVNYQAGNLAVTITDQSTGATAQQSYAINVADTIGGELAAIGFTAGAHSTEVTSGVRIRNWIAGDREIVTGDFNGDTRFDAIDIDALVARIAGGSFDAAFDMTGDGQLDLADRDAWLVAAGSANGLASGSYLVGDANLDGVVDASDFNRWNSNKFTEVAAWSAGDFNADGFVDASDFNLWNGNKFTSANRDSSSPVFPLATQIEAESERHERNERIRDAVFAVENLGHNW